MTLKQLHIAPTGMRLHEWIALERGYFQVRGISALDQLFDVTGGLT